MKRTLLLTFSFTLLWGLAAAIRATGGGEQLLGDWAGGFEEGEDYVFLQLHFKIEDGKVSGTYDAPLLFQQGRSLHNIVIEPPAVSFEGPHEPDTRVFAGELKDGLLAGRMTEGTTERSFRFTRVAPITVSNYTGAYQVEPGHFVSVRSGAEIGLAAPQFIDFKTGRFGMLFPTSTTDFFTGPGLLVPFPIEAKVTFSLNGKGRATEFVWTDTEVFQAEKVGLQQEDVTFTNRNVTLSGELVLPTSPPPHPAIVFAAGGSSYGTREMFRVFAEFFALHGVAGLIYDKRGLGASSGDWLRAGFDVLADDALAGVHLLKGRSEIDPERIGLLGASQSGWIVALAASKSNDVAFIISQSGPGVSPEESELFRSEAWLRTDGFSEAEVQEAMHFIRLRYQCALTDEGWDALAKVEEEASQKRWFVYTGGHAGKDHPFWEFWRLIRDYDPVPVMEKVTCPVLAVFGAKDTFLPAEKSARIWQAALEKAGNNDATIRVFQNGDHSLIESKTGGLKETAQARRFVPGYFELLHDWTLKQTQLK